MIHSQNRLHELPEDVLRLIYRKIYDRVIQQLTQFISESLDDMYGVSSHIHTIGDAFVYVYFVPNLYSNFFSSNH